MIHNNGYFKCVVKWNGGQAGDKHAFPDYKRQITQVFKIILNF